MVVCFWKTRGDYAPKMLVCRAPGLASSFRRIPFVSAARVKQKKVASHTVFVSGVTYNRYFVLVMFRYSASSMSEPATSSSSGEIQVDSRPSLNRANSPGRSPRQKNSNGCAKAAASNRAPSRSSDKYVRAVSRAAITTPKLTEFNYLKTATSAV